MLACNKQVPYSAGMPRGSGSRSAGGGVCGMCRAGCWATLAQSTLHATFKQHTQPPPSVLHESSSVGFCFSHVNQWGVACAGSMLHTTPHSAGRPVLVVGAGLGVPVFVTHAHIHFAGQLGVLFYLTCSYIHDL